MCRTGREPFAFDAGPCRVFAFPLGASGRVDALMTYNGDHGLLSLELYRPSTGTQIARGDLSFDPFPGDGERRTLSANVPAGSYQLRVISISSAQVAPFTIITTHP